MVRRLIVLLTALAVTAGCLVTSGPDQVSPQALSVDEQTAVDATEAFWQARFEKLFGTEYRPPRVEGPYAGTTGPSCAGQASVPFNAFYCPPGDFIAWDEQLMAAGFEKIGDAWVYLIIAHEWGHAIQARLDRGLVSVAAELQADCLAGATLVGATEDGIIRMEPGDDQELARTLVAVSDDFPWTNERDHGNAQQRISSFNVGAGGGPAACFR